MQNLYQLPKGYLLNPFNFLYQNNDVPISDNPAIRETIQNIIDIDEARLDKDLPYLEHLIQLDSLAYVRIGSIYAFILFKKLYKKVYSNFKPYCDHVLGKSVSSVRDYIDASRVALELIVAGFEYEELPNNMSQAVQLKEFTGCELIEKWKYILANIERHKRTAKSIHNLLHPPVVTEETVNTKIELPLPTFNRLIKVAYHAQLSIPETLDAVLHILTHAIKKDDILRLLRWQLDMMDLTESSS